MSLKNSVSIIGRFMRDCRGNLALFFALLSPVLFGLAGGAVDLVIYERQQAHLQDAVDGAALAAAREASLKGWNQATADAVVRAMVSANTEGSSFSSSKLYPNVVVDEVSRTVHVTLDMNQYSYFVLSYFRNNPQIRVKASATSSGETNVCIIALDGSASRTLALSGTSKMNAGGCAVFSNSSSTSGLSSTQNGLLSSQTTCSAGGYEGNSSNFSKTPTTDCPGLDDPLAARVKPSIGACDFTNLVIKNAVKTLNPGVYCGGIILDTLSLVKFNPGIYIIKDGELRARDLAAAKGVGVSFYFTGTNSRFTFDGTTVADFTAPSTGPMAGILFFQDPDTADGLVYEIKSKVASNLLGTIYLPKATLLVKTNNKVAEKSAYTVIVAKKIEIGDNTDMYINTDYSLTTVPVPEGVGPNGGNVRLLK